MLSLRWTTTPTTLLLLLLSLGNGSASDEAAVDPNGCPTVSSEYIAPMHQDSVCDRVSQNQYKASLGRYQVYERLKQSRGDHQRVPLEKTTYCPEVVQPLTPEDFEYGFDTTWIVQNTASTPVVVAYLNPTNSDTNDGNTRYSSYVETSGVNVNIIPPNFDPQAILQPGEWKAILVHEGQVFHIREILEDGSMGIVLLQHRIGLMPVTNKFGPKDLNCSSSKLNDDPEPTVVNTDPQQRHPDYRRKDPPELRLCNVMDIGFRNQVGCPLNAYYTGPDVNGMVLQQQQQDETGQAKTTTTTKPCPRSHEEVFEFHLGVNPNPDDFFFDWSSNTKYESAYIHNNFVFRLAKNEQVVVDSITLQPTRVMDCPNLKKKNQINTMISAESIISPIGQQQQQQQRNLLLWSHTNSLMRMAHSTTTSASTTSNATTTGMGMRKSNNGMKKNALFDNNNRNMMILMMKTARNTTTMNLLNATVTSSKRQKQQLQQQQVDPTTTPTASHNHIGKKLDDVTTTTTTTGLISHFIDWMRLDKIIKV